MRGALSVRLVNGSNDQIVTRHVKDLRYTKAAPGGHHSASMRITLPRSAFRDLGPASRVVVYDARSGRTRWEGYAENPGVTDGTEGQEFDLSAMGGMVLASDESRPLVYLDANLEHWMRGPGSQVAAGSTTEQGANPSTGADALMLQFLSGQPVGTSSLSQMIFDLRPADMEIGALKWTWQSGQTDAGWEERVILEGGASFNRTMSTTAATLTRRADLHGFIGAKYAIMRLIRTGGATNVATDNVWSAFSDVRILGQHLRADGTRLPHGQADYVLASNVAIDLLGRLLYRTCNTANPVIEPTSHRIDQLAYHDGATAQQVFDDLALYEPDHLWEILETGGDGKHRFNYRAWPTTARYEISVKDGYTAPGGEADLCNRIAVYWTGARGRKQTTIVTQTVPELGARVRDAEPVTLPDGLGSSANATRIGQQVLAAKAQPPKAAKATVRRPILDRRDGLTVMPWEIEPGYLVRVRETGDLLRLTETEYEDTSCAATLTLGDPVLTIEQRIARLSRRAA
jgi:hypothetical protein